MSIGCFIRFPCFGGFRCAVVGQECAHGATLASSLCRAGGDGLLKDATRPPGRKPLAARRIKQVVDLTLHENRRTPHTGACAWAGLAAEPA